MAVARFQKMHRSQNAADQHLDAVADPHMDVGDQDSFASIAHITAGDIANVSAGARASAMRGALNTVAMQQAHTGGLPDATGG